MDKATAKKEIERLRKDIAKHNQKYYNQNNPTISDKEYDDLMSQLIALEKQFPEFKIDNSPSQRMRTSPR